MVFKWRIIQNEIVSSDFARYYFILETNILLIISILCKLAKHNKVCLIMQLRSKDIIFILISPQKFGEMVLL